MSISPQKLLFPNPPHLIFPSQTPSSIHKYLLYFHFLIRAICSSSPLLYTTLCCSMDCSLVIIDSTANIYVWPNTNHMFFSWSRLPQSGWHFQDLSITCECYGWFKGFVAGWYLHLSFESTQSNFLYQRHQNKGVVAPCGHQLDTSMSMSWMVSFAFQWLSNTPSCKCTTFSLSTF